MRPRLIICILIFLIGWCESTIWSDEDTIVIEAPTPEESNRRSKQVSVPGIGTFPALPGYPIGGGIRPIGGGGVGSCYAANGEQGQCATLRQCYPILYAVDEDYQVVSEELANFLRESAGPCATPIMPNYVFFRADVEARQNFICCTSQNKKPPIIRPVTRPTLRTTTKPPSYPRPRPPTPYPSTKPTQRPADAPKQDTSSSCGKGKVVGGNVSVRGKHPWIAALTNNGRQFCGGSLIDTHHILTAAHCVSHMTANDIARLRVHLGEHTIGVSENTEQIEKVSRVMYHRGFSHQTLHNDVALLKLSAPAREATSQYIQRICLAKDTRKSFDNEKVTLAGWGQIRDGGPQSSTLREVTMDVWSNERCKARYGGMAPAGIIPSMICAASPGKDACRGDSGGPLVHYNPTSLVYTQVGVVSWGIGCGSFPGVYSRVSSFTDWITKNTRA